MAAWFCPEYLAANSARIAELEARFRAAEEHTMATKKRTAKKAAKAKRPAKTAAKKAAKVAKGRAR